MLAKFIRGGGVSIDESLPFMRWRRVLLAISVGLVGLSLVAALTRGMNFGIDFKGGLLIEFEATETPDLATIRKAMERASLGQVTLQEFGAETILLLRVQKPRLEAGQEWNPQKSITLVKQSLEQIVAIDEYRRVETVGPTIGSELRTAAALAVVFSLLGIMGYIWIRFEWHFAISAVSALLHDVIATIGFFAVTQIEFTLASVAALLTIAGYSINDTVVIFDRIRENLRKYKKMPRLKLYDLSLTQTLSRTVLTSVTTLLAVLTLVFFGGAVIADLALALGWGVLIGTYSSIGFAVPLLTLVTGSQHKREGD